MDLRVTTPPNTIWSFTPAAGGTYQTQVQLVDENGDPITTFASDEWRIVLAESGKSVGFWASSPSDWATVNSSTKRLTVTPAESGDFPINNAMFDFKIVTAGGAVYPLIVRGTAQVMPLIEEPS